jgi:hypothetical protein
MQVGERVVVVSIDGVVLLDGYLDSLNGVPAVEEVEGKSCVHEFSVVSFIMVRPGVEEMDIPPSIMTTENIKKLKDLARGRWMFPTKMVYPFTVDTHLIQKEMKRDPQDVREKRNRIEAVKFMMEWKAQHGEAEKGAMKACIDRFPQFFRSNYKANMEKARSWWMTRDVILQDLKENGKSKSQSLSTSKTAGGVRTTKFKKTRPGRGRKLSPWKKWLYPKLWQGVLRFMKAGVGMNYRRIMYVAKKIIDQSEHQLWNKNSIIATTYKREKKQKNIMALIDSGFVQGFVTHYNLSYRTPAGKMMVSPEKKQLLEKELAYHLGQLKAGFENGEFDPNNCYNVDETHFILDMRSGQIFVPKGEKDVKIMEVVSGSEGFTVVMTLKGGVDAKVMNLFVIFRNQDSSYPIQNVPDNVPHVTYRSNPTAFMNTKLFDEVFLGNTRIWGVDDPDGPKKHVWVDNVASHIGPISSNAQKKNIEKLPLPANTTHLCQPADQFVIAKFKEMYKEHFDDYILSAVEDGLFHQKIQADGTLKGSGKIRNPGKSFILQLLSKVLTELNEKKDKNGMSWAQKAMVGCGLGLNRDGKWTTEMLFPKLRLVIEKYPDYFNLLKNPYEGPGIVIEEEKKMNNDVVNNNEAAPIGNIDNEVNEAVGHPIEIIDNEMKEPVAPPIGIDDNEVMNEAVLAAALLIDDLNIDEVNAPIEIDENNNADGVDAPIEIEDSDENKKSRLPRVRKRLVRGKDDALINALVSGRADEVHDASFRFEDDYDDFNIEEL